MKYRHLQILGAVMVFIYAATTGNLLYLLGTGCIFISLIWRGE